MPETRHNFSADHDACGVGFIAQLGSTGSHEVLERALTALARLAHRGGVDADGRSGDGAGLLTAIPPAFMRRSARIAGIELPENVGLGMVFLGQEEEQPARSCIERLAAAFGLQCLGWRGVPVDSSIIGPRSLESLPSIHQVFLAAADESADLESLLFRFRKQAQVACPDVYFCSLSSKTVVYKGLLTPDQLSAFYLDLADPEFKTPFAIFHQRYSTNTQPSWRLAQPFRFAAHNGEINTVSGNRRWMRARQASLCETLGLAPNTPLLEAGMSDSASFDNALEISLRAGRTLAQSVARLVPPAWENDESMERSMRRFFQQSACEQEPWDGPAALTFSDGEMVGAKLDRNGLRPLRYTLTSDGLLIVGSEVGIADLHGKQVVERQRLGPGEMLLADPVQGTFFRPTEASHLLQQQTRRRRPVVTFCPENIADDPGQDRNRTMAAFGWTEDQFRMLFQPLVEDGQEALWSMGDDAPPALISSLRRPLWDYCKQRFAQVTNPPIDPLRESHVMSLDVYLGTRGKLSSPLLDAGQVHALSQAFAPVRRLDFTFEVTGRLEEARSALAALQSQIADNDTRPGIFVLSDRALNKERAALPALLAVSAVWRVMVQSGMWDVPLIVETGQVIDTHHVALLLTAGAAAVHPYLAMETAASCKPGGLARYRVAVEKGLRKVLARMGISTLASYRNSQLFEIVGLDNTVCAEFFEDAPHTLGGKSLDDLLEDALAAHSAGFASAAAEFRDMGLYRFRHNGERHANSPELVRRMHRYIKFPSPENHDALALLAKDRAPVAVRDVLEIKQDAPLPIDDVETEASLLSRFSTQAMSLGAISPEAHRTLAIAMNRLGGRSNTGEGGEDPHIYSDDPQANNRVKQVASGRFGVTTEYLVHADELEIKMAQGSKPGEGGQLPAIKVTPYIARLRQAVPGTSLISPPPHHDIYSIEDLAQLIYDLRAVNPRARIGVKLVSSSGVGIIAAGVAKAGADVITISGHDGGTGASPLTSIKNTGISWEAGLRDAHSALLRAGLRARVRLRVDGGLKFARDVVIAALLGAEEFGFGTAALLAIGCVMARQCHLNTCPVGIATQNEQLRARFAGNPEMVETFFRALATDVRELLAAMGARSIDEIVGAADRLLPRTAEDEETVEALLRPILGAPEQFPCPHEDSTHLRLALNRTIDELERFSSRSHVFRITSEDRAVGAHFSGQILRRLGGAALQVSPVDCEFVGIAGQSFGAFLISGANFRLTGEANDYVGKGLSGGTIAISAGPEASERGDVLVGNTVLYGATSGELYVAGRAGERFAVRNSGALAVVEGVGQHGCEYMTAGVAVVIGPAGINFGAGMTGGLAYILRDSVHDHCNNQSVRFAALEMQEERWLRRILRRHLQLTVSPRAARLLSSATLPFLRVEPLQPPCSVEETWATILARLGGFDAQSFEPRAVAPSEGPLVM
jgi:glutamate synthase (ferredoxin)